MINILFAKIWWALKALNILVWGGLALAIIASLLGIW